MMTSLVTLVSTVHKETQTHPLNKCHYTKIRFKTCYQRGTFWLYFFLQKTFESNINILLAPLVHNTHISFCNFIGRVT